MRQWMLRITAYAESLLHDLDTIDWSDSLKEMQRNWIGRSEGAEVDFQIASDVEPDKIRVFTTRPDTLVRRDLHGAGARAQAGGSDHHARHSEQAVDEYKTDSRQKVRPRTHRTGQGKDRRLHRRLRHQSRSTARKSPSGLPTTCSPATAPAPSWPCRRTTRATSSSPPSSICRSSRSSSRPSRKRLARLRRRRRLGEFDRAGNFHHRPAHAGSQEENHRLAGSKGPRQEDHQLQAPRLALQPPALLGRAVPDRLEDATPDGNLYHEALPESRLAAAAAGAGRLQTHARRPAAARPRARTG